MDMNRQKSVMKCVLNSQTQFRYAEFKGCSKLGKASNLVKAKAKANSKAKARGKGKGNGSMRKFFRPCMLPRKRPRAPQNVDMEGRVPRPEADDQDVDMEGRVPGPQEHLPEREPENHLEAENQPHCWCRNSPHCPSCCGA